MPPSERSVAPMESGLGHEDEPSRAVSPVMATPTSGVATGVATSGAADHSGMDNGPLSSPPNDAECAQVSDDNEHHHHHYIFARLRRRVPPPSRQRIWGITAALMVSMLLCGWTEGSTGPLIPRLQEYYNINYLVMSLIYSTMFVGSLIGGLTNVWITDRIGFGLACPLGALAHAISYLLAGTGAPYAVFLVAYAFNGFGLSLQVNNLTSRLPNAGTKMAFVQAFFGLGGAIAPFLSTTFAAHVDKAWYYYFVAMGVALIAVVIMLFAFQGRTEEQLIQPSLAEQSAAEPSEKTGAEVVEPNNDAVRETDEPEVEAPKKAPSSGEKMKRIFATPAVWALMAFSFLYIGVEVAISSWMTTFLIRERGGSANAGYAVVGFWGGMTLGRIVLIPVTNFLGYQSSLYLYSALALALELTIWFTHSLVGNGVCYAFIGFFLGPVYVNALMVVAELLDDDLRGGVMGLMGSVGGAGAAALPFMTGGIADRHGIWTVQPIAVGLTAGYTVLWALVPRKRITSRLKPKT